MINLFWLKHFQVLVDKYAYLGLSLDASFCDLDDAQALYRYLLRMEEK